MTVIANSQVQKQPSPSSHRQSKVANFHLSELSVVNPDIFLGFRWVQISTGFYCSVKTPMTTSDVACCFTLLVWVQKFAEKSRWHSCLGNMSWYTAHITTANEMQLVTGHHVLDAQQSKECRCAAATFGYSNSEQCRHPVVSWMRSNHQVRECSIARISFSHFFFFIHRRWGNLGKESALLHSWGTSTTKRCWVHTQWRAYHNRNWWAIKTSQWRYQTVLGAGWRAILTTRGSHCNKTGLAHSGNQSCLYAR